MPNTSFSKTFSVDISSTDLGAGDVLYYKLVLDTPTISDFTASISQGRLSVSSLAPAVGYSSVSKPILDAGAITSSANTNQIIFNNNISNFYGEGYQFVPNPETGSAVPNSLYSVYGDVDNPFYLKLFDIFIIYLSDGTYVEYRIINAYIESNQLKITLDNTISQLVKNDIENQTYKRILFLTRRKDETNIVLTFKKKQGKTSYGFIIPENLDPEVFKNIDVIAKEIQSKLLSNQPAVQVNSIDTISGGGF